jgi:hypothetical protein
MSASDTIAKLNRRLQVKIRVATREAAKEIIQIVIDVIKIRTRLEGEGKGKAFDILEESTKAYRKKYESRLHPDTTPEKSNVTATGQMLDALTGKTSGSKVTIFIKNTKRKRELSGSRSTLTNEQVRRYVEEEGKKREFLFLSDQDEKEVIEVATEIIRQNIRNLLK